MSVVQETVLKGDGNNPLGITNSTSGSGPTVTVVNIAGDKSTSGLSKRPSKTSFVRSGSFRSKHKVKAQESLGGGDMSSSSNTRGKSPGDGRTWRIRHFGYYDMQSISVDRLGYQITQGDPQHRLKKHTGASAALLQENGEDNSNSTEISKPVDNELVALCPSFTNEIGGGDWSGGDNIISKLREALSDDKKLRLCSRERIVLDGDLLNEESTAAVSTAGNTLTSANNDGIFTVQSGLTFPLEFIDHGACYYRHHFYDKDHQTFLGIDEGLGPVVISLRREKVNNEIIQYYSQGQPSNERVSHKYQYRIILRTSEIPTLRGTIMEESIPSSIKAGSQRGIPPREVIEYVTQGEIQTSSFKLAKSDEKTMKELMRLDEQELNNRYKVGVLYCKAGQITEEEWYNNETGSPAFDEFLDLIGERVKMKGFNKYRAQLDNKTDTTGEYSIYTTYENSEVMFHVSTLLPFTPANKQQLLRKRHIGNDIVTLIFQEPGSVPFSPKTIRSHFQHIFIIVKVTNPNTDFTEYKVAVTRSNDVPYFGPPIPEGGTFQKSEKFRNFLTAKLINACNAALQSDKLYAMATRTRKQYLSDLCKEACTSITIDQAGGGALGRLFGRKRDRTGLISPLLFTPGAMSWSVSIIFRHWKPLPFSEEDDHRIECTLCLAPDVLTFIDNNKVALLHIPTQDISGFSNDRSRINLFYDRCYCISLEFHDSEDDLQDFCKRLVALSHAQEAILLEFGRSVISGLLGFTIDQNGTVVKVDGLAKMRGLQKGAQVLQVEDKLVSCNKAEDIAELLHDKNRGVVRAFVVPPVPKRDKLQLHRRHIEWDEVWSLRPQALNDSDNLEDNNTTTCNMSTKSSPPPNEDEPNVVQLRKFSADTVFTGPHSSSSNSKRLKNRPEFLQVDPFQQDENIYDRLMSYGNRGSVSPSAKSTGSVGGAPLSPCSTTSAGRSYSRLKVTQPKAIRQSVLQLANNIMDHSGEDGESSERYSWTPQAVNHQIEEHSPYFNTHISQSTAIPDRRHTASPLSAVRKHPTPGALGEKTTDNLPHIGQVYEMKKRFSLQYSTSVIRRRPSRNSAHVPIVVSQDQEPLLQPSSNNNRSGRGSRQSGGSGSRPLSWDATELLDEEEPMPPERKESRGESLPPPERTSYEDTSVMFQRNAHARQPVRSKLLQTPPPLNIVEPSPVEEEDILESLKNSELTPQLISQLTSEDSPTKLLDEVLEQFEDGGQKEVPSGGSKMNTLSVKARTQIWELKAHTQTLPRSFKTRTASQPNSPMKKSSFESPLATPTGSSTHLSRFTFNSPEDISMKRSDEGGETSAASSYYRTRGSLSPSSSPKHRTLPFPQKPPSLATTSHTHNGYGNDKSKATKQLGGGAKRPLINSLSEGHVINANSPKSHSEKHFSFDVKGTSDTTNTLDSQQLSWDSVMGDITSYCRSVAEWVKQTESAGTLDNPPVYEAPPSPTGSDAFSYTTTSIHSEPVYHLKNKVEQLENKLEQESESNKELRLYLKKMERQISDLQKKQIKPPNSIQT